MCLEWLSSDEPLIQPGIFAFEEAKNARLGLIVFMKKLTVECLR
ncbi:MAG: hypothetical protein QXN22_03315 [Thermofilaceae archaeon]